MRDCAFEAVVDCELGTPLAGTGRDSIGKLDTCKDAGDPITLRQAVTDCLLLLQLPFEWVCGHMMSVGTAKLVPRRTAPV